MNVSTETIPATPLIVIHHSNTILYYSRLCEDELLTTSCRREPRPRRNTPCYESDSDSLCYTKESKPSCSICLPEKDCTGRTKGGDRTHVLFPCSKPVLSSYTANYSINGPGSPCSSSSNECKRKCP